MTVAHQSQQSRGGGPMNFGRGVYHLKETDKLILNREQNSEGY